MLARRWEVRDIVRSSFALGGAVLLGAIGSAVAAAWAGWSPRERVRRTAVIALALGVLYGITLASDIAGDAIRARRGTSLHVQLLVRQAKGRAWRQEIVAKAGSTVDYQLRIKNVGPGRADHLLAGVTGAEDLVLVCGSLEMFNGANPQGLKLSSKSDDCLGEHLFGGGIEIGNYEPEAVTHLYWRMRLPRGLTPGEHIFSPRGMGRVPKKTNDIFNVAIVRSLYK